MSTRRSPAQEANLIANYLIGATPSRAQTSLYTRAVKSLGAASEKKTYAAAMAYPGLLPYLDAYDAFFRPSSQLRQRLYIMFAVLEASPQFASSFLPVKRPWWYVAVFCCRGTVAVFRLIVGSILVKARGL